jgi:hypothetical protein
MGGLAACVGGADADDPTDANGQTEWRDSLVAGGHTVPGSELTQVYVNGEPLQSGAGVDVQFNSADIDGSGAANLTDISLFTQTLFGDYSYRADFLWDGAINLSDAILMTQGNGAACP